VAFNTASTQTQWWILITASSTAGSGFQIISGPAATIKAKYGSTALGPYMSQSAAQSAAEAKVDSGQISTAPPPGSSLIGSDISSWLQGIGGSIGSGIEGGIVSLLTDIWNVIVGPLEVIAGVLIAVFVFIIYFKDDIMQLAGMAAKAAMVVA